MPLKINITNQELPEELHKSIITKFERQKVYSPFIYNVRGVDIVDMQLISKFNKEIIFYYVLFIFSVNKYVLSH